MKKIPIGEATEAQLRSFATDTLGIDIKATAKFATVRARVEQAWDKPEITVMESEPDDAKIASQASPQAVTDEQQAPEEGMVRLVVGVTEQAGGNDPVELGVNGKIMLVPRGIEVEIPYPYFEVLKHAVQDKYDPLPDGGMKPEPRKVPLYPFQVIERAAARSSA